jgi:hypothetical protein
MRCLLYVQLPKLIWCLPGTANNSQSLSLAQSCQMAVSILHKPVRWCRVVIHFAIRVCKGC